jgi:hypothetical protein
LLLDRVREMFACAALEGNMFTAEAVARAVNWDRDALIDLLDDHLTGDIGPLREAAPAEIQQMGGQTRTLWRYRFIRDLDRRIARIRFSSPAERRSLAQRLAPALIATYAPEEHRVAGVLTTLFVQAGDADAARHYRRIANFGVTQTTLRAQAQYIVGADTETWSAWELAWSAELLLHAAHVLSFVDPYPDTLVLAEVAGELAARAHARLEEP